MGFHVVHADGDGEAIPAEAISDLSRDRFAVVEDGAGLRLIVETPAAIDGACLEDLQVSFTPETGRPNYVITFKKSCVQTFADVTRDNLGKQLAIVIDGDLISAPIMNQVITGGMVVIDGY